jgi:hypothetical protein
MAVFHTTPLQQQATSVPKVDRYSLSLPSSSSLSFEKITTTPNSAAINAHASPNKPSILAVFEKSHSDDTSSSASSSSSSKGHKDMYYFRRIAMELAKHEPSEILYELNTYDPFGVRKVLQQIQMAELQNHNQTISLSQLKSFFPCPSVRNRFESTSTKSSNHISRSTQHDKIAALSTSNGETPGLKSKS